MKNSIKVLLYIFFVVIIFIFVQERFDIFDISFKGEDQKKEEGEEEEKKDENIVEIYNEEGNTILVRVDIADDNEERRLGLSGRRNLGDYEGMLFIMNKEELSSFWMKDMLISLDMIFIDSKGFIVDIKEGLKPCEKTSCPNIYPSSPFKYVLEVNSGFSRLNRVVVGNSIVFNISSEK